MVHTVFPKLGIFDGRDFDACNTWNVHLKGHLRRRVLNYSPRFLDPLEKIRHQPSKASAIVGQTCTERLVWQREE